MSVGIWNAVEQKLEKVAGKVNLNDSSTSEEHTWSSKKISDSLVDLESELDEKENKVPRRDNPSDKDLDTYTSAGRYSIGSPATYSNVPVTDSGILIVENSATYKMQMYITESRTFVRRNRGTRWDDWKELATMDSIEGIRLTANRTYTVTSVEQYNTLTLKGLYGGAVIYDLIPLNSQSLNPKVKHLGDFTEITVSDMTPTSCKITIPQSCVVSLKSTKGGITAS